MLIAPTEPKAFAVLGATSSIPETRGVDFLFVGQDGMVGVQRKEVKDYVSSIRDGRLARELGQMAGGDLATRWLIVEGDWRWDYHGDSETVPGFSQAQFDGSVMSLQVTYDVKVFHTSCTEDTVRTLAHMESWHQKNHRSSLSIRPKGRSPWGTSTSREWSINFLQGFDGLSVVRAGAIFDHFGGLPIAWTVTEEELLAVPGIGPKTAKKLWEALHHGP